LGLIGGMLLTTLLIALFAKEARPGVRKSAIGGLIAVVVIVVGFFAIKNTAFVQESPVLHRFADISFQEKTTKSRFQIWGLAIDGFKEHPILGWGQDNFNLVFSKYYDPRLYDQEPFFDRAHNVFLDWLIAGGALGLLAYLSLFAFALYYIWRRREEGGFSVTEKSILTGLLAAYFFQNLFVFDNLMSYILFFSVLGYIHVHSAHRAPTESTAREIDINTQYIAMAVILVAFVFAMYAVNIKNISANKALLQAISPHKEEGLQANIDYFKEALSYDTFGNGEIRERLIQYAAQVPGIQGASDQIKQQAFAFAREEMLKQIADAPEDVRYELMLGGFLRQFGQYEESIAHLKRAVELSPNKQSTYFELVSAYVRAEQYEEAFALAEVAYELEKSNPIALEIYAVTALYSGDTELAEKLIIEKYGTLVVDSDNLLNAYARTGAHELVVEIWQKRIEASRAKGQDNPQFHVSLAAAYLAAGQRQNAIEELQITIELSPDFKAQGEYYISEIRAGRNP